MERRIQDVTALENIETGTGFLQCFHFSVEPVRLFSHIILQRETNKPQKPLSECRHRISQYRLLKTKAQIFRNPPFYGQIISGTGTGDRALVIGPGPGQDFSQYH
jgi:hypothetical protein